MIVGENEPEAGKVMLKDMLNGLEFEVKLDELRLILKELLGRNAR